MTTPVAVPKLSGLRLLPVLMGVALVAVLAAVVALFFGMMRLPAAIAMDWLAGPLLPLILLGVAAFALAASAILYASTANIRRSAEAQAKQNQRNQEAILRLLDELSSLADGDLTVRA